MKQKTIRLSDDYRLNNGVLEVFKITSNDDETGLPNYEYVPSIIKIGDSVMLVSSTDVSPNALRTGTKERFFIKCNCPDGIGGNSNPKITRYHGWRGTTNDNSICAHGLRKIIKIGQTKNGIVTVTVGRDLQPDEA